MSRIMDGEEYLLHTNKDSVEFWVKSSLIEKEFSMFDNIYVDMAIDEFYRGGQENNFLRMRSNKDRMPTFAFLHKVDAWVNGEEVQFDDWVDENKVFSKRPGSCDTWNNVVIKRVEMYVNGKCPKDHLNGRMIVDYQWENGTLVGLNARFGKIM